MSTVPLLSPPGWAQPSQLQSWASTVQPKDAVAHFHSERQNPARPSARPTVTFLLDPIGLHESRHTFASLMIASGVNAKALSKIMGHASISITFDVYGHLMPGGESERLSGTS